MINIAAKFLKIRQQPYYNAIFCLLKCDEPDHIIQSGEVACRTVSILLICGHEEAIVPNTQAILHLLM